MIFRFWKNKKPNVEIERLTKLAYYDTLTGLPNRLLFQQESTKAMKFSVKKNDPLTVFLIDLDNFKHINDTYGHETGDTVLKEIATRLQALRNSRCSIAEVIQKCERSCKCIASRLGGDEFVIVFEHMDRHEAKLVAMQTINILKEPILANNQEIIVSASIGISIFPWDANDFSSLLKAADLAMYVAKENGKDQFAFHESYMNTKIERRVQAELLIRDIINKGNIELGYQPVFNVDTEKVTGFEALFRSNKSKDGFSPSELITVAEESNLIVQLGSIIFEKACEFGCECIDAGYDLSVSINVSAPQLADQNFRQTVEDILKRTGLPAQNLCLEITETILLANFEQSAQTLEHLKNMGIRISIDDFGKGYSSFNYLHLLPVNKLKIDMSFVQLLGENKKANIIVKSIIEMADALAMETCAEGVETKQQLLKLREFGCERAQGHYKYPALSALEFFNMLDQENVPRFS